MPLPLPWYPLGHALQSLDTDVVRYPALSVYLEGSFGHENSFSMHSSSDLAPLDVVDLPKLQRVQLELCVAFKTSLLYVSKPQSLQSSRPVSSWYAPRPQSSGFDMPARGHL